jgi:hypothetical protein
MKKGGPEFPDRPKSFEAKSLEDRHIGFVTNEPHL